MNKPDQPDVHDPNFLANFEHAPVEEKKAVLLAALDEAVAQANKGQVFSGTPKAFLDRIAQRHGMVRTAAAAERLMSVTTRRELVSSPRRVDAAIPV